MATDCCLFLFLSVCFTLLDVTAADTPPQCQTTDYIPSYSPCNKGTRWVSYKKNATCVGPNELAKDTASCRCRPDEYVAVYGECKDGVRPFKEYHVINDCVKQDDMPHPNSAPCACTEADIVSEYTKCDPETMTQRLVHYFVSNCDSSSMTLPPPQIMPCDVSCPSGEFLSPPQTACTPCPAGTFSVRGLVIDRWDEMPKDFHTSCIGAFCKSWQPQGEYIDSGSQDHAGILSSLQFRTKVMAPVANITVTFRVESQWYWDFFIIVINGVRQDLFIEDTTGINKEWMTVTLDLHQQQCEAEIFYHAEGHCLIRNYFDPPPAGGGQFVDHAAIKDMEIAIPHPKTGCDASDWLGISVAGRVAVVRRGNCTFVQKARQAQAHGALGLVVVNSDNEPVRMVGDASDITIPVAMIVAQGGDPLLELAASGEDILVDITPAEVNEAKVEFHYSKWDNDAKRDDAGADRVFIRSIRTEGTVRAPKECHPCQPGEYSPPSSSHCLPCPANTYSDKPGTGKCIPCGQHEMSLPGATGCTTTADCTVEDYIAIYGPCEEDTAGEFRSKVTYRNAINPPLCSGDPPKPKEVPCPPCPVGTIRNKDSSECEPCKKGHRASGDECVVCPEGTAAIKKLVYDPFPTEWPYHFETACNGHCLNPWHFMTYKEGDRYINTVASGKGMAVGSQAALLITAVLYTEGEIRFQHFDVFGSGIAPRDQRNAVFEMKHLGSDHHPFHIEVPLPPSKSSGQVFDYSSGPIGAGDYLLVFSYNRTEGVEFVLRSLTIIGEGSGDGGADTCTPCPAGTFCIPGIDKPYPCSQGQYTSGPRSSSCEDCPRGTISDATRTRCDACPAPMVPHSVGHYCVLPDCRFSVPVGTEKLTYDLGRLGVMHAVEGTEGESKEVKAEYHLSLCSAMQDIPDEEEEEFSVSQLCGSRETPAFACQVVEGAPPVVLGSVQEVSFSSLAEKTPGDLVVTLAGGDLCTNGRRYKSVVRFACQAPSPKTDPSKVDTTPQLHISIKDDCTYEMVVRSPLACPLCTNASYTYGLGPCKENKRQTRSWFLKDGVQCFGGVVLAEEEIPCHYTVTVSFGLNLFTITVTLVALVFSWLGCGLIFMVYQNRKMYEQYNRVSQNANHDLSEELEDVPCAADDDNEPLDDF